MNMNRKTFLRRLNRRLSALPAAERSRSTAYYAEMIDDRIEAGVAEEEAVAQLGDVNEIAAQILQESGAEPRRRIGALEIALLVLGSPVWLMVLVALGVALLAIYLAIWSAIAAVFAVDISLAAAALALLAAIFSGFAEPAAALLLSLGTALLLAGLAILGWFAALAVARTLAHLSGCVGRWAVSRFKRSGGRLEK